MNKKSLIELAISRLLEQRSESSGTETRHRNAYGTDRFGLIEELVKKVTRQNGGKMSGKTIGGIVIIAVVVIAGFLAYRFIMMDMIMRMSA